LFVYNKYNKKVKNPGNLNIYFVNYLTIRYWYLQSNNLKLLWCLWIKKPFDV